MTGEDPSFYGHNGFYTEAIRQSIAQNYIRKRFARGGSTISMQLVKNVFLSRQKTLSRKAEEILIVWLIENNQLIGKQRMLEVYFNIIEMGTNVYGIGEATRHYFGKTPAELTVGEGIFLANIVPRPKAALFKFMSDGSLKEYLYPYFNFIGNTMARRGLTVTDTTGYGFYNVRLKESLRQYLMPDSLTLDTTVVDFEDELMPPGGMQDKSKILFDKLFSNPKKDTVVKNKADTTKNNKLLRREEKRKTKEKTQ
jgi:hypothetical protein